MNNEQRKPPESAVREAKKNPNGWVYDIDTRYNLANHVPPEAIRGAWKVDGSGSIIGDFIPNLKYKPFAESE
jgi:hypothetical protein